MKKLFQGKLRLLTIPTLIVIGILIFPFGVDLFLENSSYSNKLWLWVAQFTNYESPILIIVAFIILGCYFFAYLVLENFSLEREYKAQSEDIEKKFEEKSKMQAAIILDKNDNLRKVELQKSIRNVMETFVQNNNNVLAAQLYKYETVSEQYKIKYKVTYYDGYVGEGTEINGVLQQYYSMQKKDFYKYVEGLQKFTTGENDDILMDYIEEKINYFNSKNYFSSNEDGLIYATLLDAYAILSTVSEELESIDFPKHKKNKLEKLKKSYKRLSIFRGILVNRFYMSEYEGSGEKKNRIYATAPIKIFNSTMLLLIAVDGELLIDAKKIENNLDELLELIGKLNKNSESTTSPLSLLSKLEDVIKEFAKENNLDEHIN